MKQLAVRAIYGQGCSRTGESCTHLILQFTNARVERLGGSLVVCELKIKHGLYNARCMAEDG